jgi:hypothetical protein
MATLPTCDLSDFSLENIIASKPTIPHCDPFSSNNNNPPLPCLELICYDCFSSTKPSQVDNHLESLIQWFSFLQLIEKRSYLLEFAKVID